MKKAAVLWTGGKDSALALQVSLNLYDISPRNVCLDIQLVTGEVSTRIQHDSGCINTLWRFTS